MSSDGTDDGDSDEERIDRKHTHPVADGGSKYRDPIHADADRSEVPHDYEGPTKLERVMTRRPQGNVTEMVEVPDREEKARRQREQNTSKGVGDDNLLEKAAEEAYPSLDDSGESDSDVEKSKQEWVDALADMNFYGIDGPRRPESGVEKAEDGDPLSPTKAEIERELNPPMESEKDLLRDIRGETHALNRKAEFGGSGGGSGVSKAGMNAVELLETVEDELERRDGATEEIEGATRLTEEQTQVLEDAVNLYVAAAYENSVDDPLTDVVAWMQDQAGEMDGQARQKVYAALASIQNAEMEQSETPV